MIEADNDPRHGTVGGYVYHGCRCDACAKANTKRKQKETLKRKERLQRGEGDPPHGKDSTYTNWGCRCRQCMDAHNAAKRAWKRKRKAGDEVQPTGT